MAQLVLDYLKYGTWVQIPNPHIKKNLMTACL